MLLPLPAHISTIIPFFVRGHANSYERHRFETLDHDFFEVDVLTAGHQRAFVLLHGLEGSSSSGYISATAHQLHTEGWDVHCLHFRGCSGVPNRLFASYHSGFTQDLAQYMAYICTHYTAVYAIGFSLGGNALLKYLGEYAGNSFLTGAMAVSVPLYLAGCAFVLDHCLPRFYVQRFLGSMSRKVLQKAMAYPESADYEAIARARTFYEFDTLYTAPAFGYRSASEYWRHNSALSYISRIDTPTLLIQALDDPFLSKECFPQGTSKVHVHYSTHGGHVGFISTGTKGLYWLHCMQEVLDYRSK